MEIDCIPFKETTYFSSTICDYLEEKDNLKPFYNRFPNLKNFKEQLKEKQESFSTESRHILHNAIVNQYDGVDSSAATKDNIMLFKDTNTFTVVTGHQLNLFTGPLYFLYKIISTINLTRQLKEAYPDYNFVPIYWMATEDHDFDEINYFNFKRKKVQWSKDASGAVGKLNTNGLEAIYDVFANQLGGSTNEKALKQLFKGAYLENNTLTEATRYLANTLFKAYGLVIVDGDDKKLKEQLIPFIKNDILDNASFNKVSETISKLNKQPENYNIQVNPREINYFYLSEGLRERIIAKGDSFYVNNTDIEFSKEAIIEEIDKYPQRFSPNVICRPFYQELILPNLCYIGGGGELAYWLELKSFFKTTKVPFPILLLRNSALVISKKQKDKLSKLDINTSDLFLKQNSFINKKIRQISNIDIDFSAQKEELEKQFEGLYKLAKQTDASFLGAVKAQEKKQLRGLATLEKRLLKAQKRKLKDHVVRITEIQNQLFPNKSLQERNQNFSELYMVYGEALIPSLMKALQPLSGKFTILTMD